MRWREEAIKPGAFRQALENGHDWNTTRALVEFGFNYQMRVFDRLEGLCGNGDNS